MSHINTLYRSYFLVIFFLVVSATMAQNKDNLISIQGNKISVKEAFSQIEQQTEYSIAYEQSEIDLNKRISLFVKNEGVDKVISQILRETDLTYKRVGYHIIISRKSIGETKIPNNKINNYSFKIYVLDESTKKAIAGVSISSNNEMLSITDENGYALFKVSKNTRKIHFSRIGYESRAVELNSSESKKSHTIYLRPKAESLQEVVVTSSVLSKINAAQMGNVSLNQQEIKNIPTVFGEADIIKALQTQPGVSSGIEGFAGMYVRGGNDDENLLMIDGNPLYQVNHFGGLFSSFNVEAVESVNFYKSAFPAKYGGRLSSVMNVQTKDGNFKEWHGTVSLGLTSGNINLEAPIIKDKLAFNFSARRSWLELLTIPALAIINKKDKGLGKKTIGTYSFTDVNFKLNYKLNTKSNLYFTLYNGHDYLKIGDEEFSVDTEDTYNKKNVNKLNWGNTLTALGWEHQFSPKLKMENVLSYTHYKSTLKDTFSEKWEDLDGNDFEENNMSKERVNSINDIGFRSTFSYYPNEKHIINWGVGYLNHRYLPEKMKMQIVESSAKDMMYQDQKLHANEYSLFVEDDWMLSSFLRINAGLRFSSFNILKKTYHTLEPRVSTRFLINKKLSIKASYARMTQFAQQVSDSYISLPTDFWIPISDKFKPLKSDQVSVGLYYDYSQTYSASVEGYYKWMNNLLEYKDGYSYLPLNASWGEKLASGKGTAYGIDITIDKKTGRLKGSIGYGLMWTDRHFAEINRGRHFPSKYDNRHKINITGSYSIKKNIDLNFSWIYMTGNRISLSLEHYQDLPTAGFPSEIAPIYPYPDHWGINHYDSKNNVRLPAYHRLDLGINIYRPKKNNRMGIWNISIYNAYCKMNPIVIQKESMFIQSDNPSYKFRSLSIFPIIPSVSYTYKF